MEPELVIHPQEGGVDLILCDLLHRTVVLALVILSADPVGFLIADGTPERCTAGATGNFEKQRITLPFRHDDRPAVQQFFHRIEGFAVDDRRVALRQIILLSFSVVDFFLIGKRICGVSFLKQCVPNIPFIPKDIGDGGVLPVSFFIPGGTPSVVTIAAISSLLCPTRYWLKIVRTISASGSYISNIPFRIFQQYHGNHQHNRLINEQREPDRSVSKNMGQDQDHS